MSTSKNKFCHIDPIRIGDFKDGKRMSNALPPESVVHSPFFMDSQRSVSRVHAVCDGRITKNGNPAFEPYYLITDRLLQNYRKDENDYPAT